MDNAITVFSFPDIVRIQVDGIDVSDAGIAVLAEQYLPLTISGIYDNNKRRIALQG